MTKEDKETLRHLLSAVQRLLEWIVNDTETIQDRELLDRFKEGLSDIRRHFALAHDVIGGADDAATPFSAGLEQVGLTGVQLQLKTGVLDWSFGVGRATLRRVLRWVNSFLGSLAKVPGLGFMEAVKEFKEQIEVIIEHQHGGGLRVPRSILGL